MQDSTVQTTLTEQGEEAEPILSAHVARNSEAFPKILDLHVETGAVIGDVTYGKGVFWKNVALSDYELYASDLDAEKSPSGYPVDCRNLPYEECKCVV